jgi:hypothetical protein
VPELISPLERVEEISLPPTPEPESPPDAPGGGAMAELDAVRELVLRAHRDVVPELVAGDSVAGILASVAPARAAYARLAEGWAGPAPRAVPVPAGGGAPLPTDPSLLPASEKIRRGLAAGGGRRSS